MTNLQLRIVTKWKTTNAAGMMSMYWTPDFKMRTMFCSEHQYPVTPDKHHVTFAEFKSNFVNHKPLDIEGVPVEFYKEYKNSKMTKEEFLYTKRGTLKSRKFGF